VSASAGALARAFGILLSAPPALDCAACGARWVPAEEDPKACPLCGAPIDGREIRALEPVKAAEVLDSWRAKFDDYRTTADSCDCPDSLFRKADCKHRRAFRMLAAREATRG
jgi:hypothetical protein